MIPKIAAALVSTALLIFLVMECTDLMSAKSDFSMLGWPALALLFYLYVMLLFAIFNPTNKNTNTENENR